LSFRLRHFKWVWLAGVVSLAAVAALNSAEKKATREAQAVANESVGRVRQSCGNRDLKFVFDWGPYRDLDYTVGGRSREEALRLAGDRANRVANAFIAVCSDPKYREGISQLSEVRLAPHEDARNFRIELKRQGNRMQAEFGAFGMSATEDLTAEVRSQF
jgi:hypothetical protein